MCLINNKNKEQTNNQLMVIFDKVYTPYTFEMSQTEIDLVNEAYNNGFPLAELILIILDFQNSTVEYINPLTGFGPGDVLDDIQEKTFEKLLALGKKYPLAYKVAGEIQLGLIGRIYFHNDKALPYFKMYAEATGDNEIVDDYENYCKKMWKEFLDIQSYQRNKKYLSRKNGITYSHDPSFYDDLHDD